MTLRKRIITMGGLLLVFGSGTVVGVLARPAAGGAEKHPYMQAALKALNVAAANLNKGAWDFKGKRVLLFFFPKANTSG